MAKARASATRTRRGFYTGAPKRRAVPSLAMMIPQVRAAAAVGLKLTRSGKVARGSRRSLNSLMNDQIGKPLGKHGLTWSQLLDRGYVSKDYIETAVEDDDQGDE